MDASQTGRRTSPGPENRVCEFVALLPRVESSKLTHERGNIQSVPSSYPATSAGRVPRTADQEPAIIQESWLGKFRSPAAIEYVDRN